MYDFDCRVMKMEAPATRDMQEMMQIEGEPNNS